jgi:hypothetical protein
LCFHKMSLWHFVFPQSGINMIYYPDCSLAPLAGHLYFIDFFEGSDRTWIFGLKSNDLESSWQQFQPSSDSVFHRGTRVHTWCCPTFTFVVLISFTSTPRVAMARVASGAGWLAHWHDMCVLLRLHFHQT